MTRHWISWLINTHHRSAGHCTSGHCKLFQTLFTRGTILQEIMPLHEIGSGHARLVLHIVLCGQTTLFQIDVEKVWWLYHWLLSRVHNIYKERESPTPVCPVQTHCVKLWHNISVYSCLFSDKLYTSGAHKQTVNDQRPSKRCLVRFGWRQR